LGGGEKKKRALRKNLDDGTFMDAVKPFARRTKNKNESEKKKKKSAWDALEVSGVERGTRLGLRGSPSFL